MVIFKRTQKIARKSFWLLFFLCHFKFSNGDIPKTRYYGQRTLNARRLALGGNEVSVVDGYALYHSPSLLPWLENHKLELSFLGLSLHNERRTMNVFDQFENKIAEYTFAENSNLWWNLPIFTIVLARKPWGIGLGVKERTIFNYRYEYKKYDEFYQLIDEEYCFVDGRILSANIGLGRKFFNRLALGTNFKYLFGRREVSRKLLSEEKGGISASNFKTLAFTTSTSLSLKENFVLTFAYQSKELFSDTIKYPSRLGMGLHIFYPSRIPTSLFFEYSIGRNQNEVKIGVEHLLFDNSFLRYGTRSIFYPFPSQPRFSFSFGIGYLLEKFIFDFGSELSWTKFDSQAFLSPLKEEFNVYENEAKIIFTFTYSL